LADAHGRGEVVDGVHAFEGLADGVGVADVADDQLDLVVEIVGAAGVLAVDLRAEVVQGTDPITGEE
jgi:hypothetical protein